MAKKKTNSEIETKSIAGLLAKKIFRAKKTTKTPIIALKGDLGSGKTAFVRGFLRAEGVRGSINSPTFTLIKRYPLKNGLTAFHMDAYRIKSIKELKSLRFEEILNNPKNILLIEWPERIWKRIPKHAVTIKFTHGKNEKERIIEIL